MRFFRDVFCGFFCSLLIQTLLCTAGLPPPIELSYEWMDDLTVRLKWKEPPGVPAGMAVWYRVDGKETRCTSGRNNSETIFSDDVPQTYTIRSAITRSECDSSANLNASITVHPKLPRAKVVKDVFCYHGNWTCFCSWTPVNHSSNLELSFRDCRGGRHYMCPGPHRDGEKYFCYININPADEICVVAKTESAMQTFKVKNRVLPPKLEVREEGNHLQLSIEGPDIGNDDCWSYELCYSQCNLPQFCQMTKDKEMSINYKKVCQYKFKAKIVAVKECPQLESDYSEVVTHGKNDWTLTVIAIVIPIVLSACVILSCYCFRRHKAIICPIIPDPSAMLKEMMNGNKDMKGASGVYTPMPEIIEYYKITPMYRS